MDVGNQCPEATESRAGHWRIWPYEDGYPCQGSLRRPIARISLLLKHIAARRDRRIEPLPDLQSNSLEKRATLSKLSLDPRQEK